MSDLGLLLRHFSTEAAWAVAGAERVAQDAKVSQVHAHHLARAVALGAGIGARALRAADIPASAISNVPPPAPRRWRMPKPTFRRPPTNDAARLLARLSPLDRVANLIFNRIRHPAEGEDFQHAVTLAFRISQRRSSDITDTGDLLLALLAMLARELADVPFRTTDLNQMIDEQRRRKPERRPDPRHQPG